jgi:hypothetical protein
MRRYHFFTAVFFLVAILFLFGCADSEENDEGSSSSKGGDNDTEGGDNDTLANPFHAIVDSFLSRNDSMTSYDDADDDDADAYVPIPDIEYDSFLCDIPDPESIGAGKSFSATPSTGTITVYVFDDRSCAPLAGATVILGNNTIMNTDSTGKAVFSTTTHPGYVSAIKPEYNMWTYHTDADVIYFRLSQRYYRDTYYESNASNFRLEGAPLALDNPQSIVDTLTQPFYLGVVFRGFVRERLFTYSDYDEIWVWDGFPMGINDGYGSFTEEFFGNFCAPPFSISIPMPGGSPFEFYGGTDQFRIPLMYNQEVSYNGAMLKLNTDELIGAGLLNQIITDIIGGNDLLDVITPVVKPFINDMLSIAYVGIEPGYQGSTPDLNVVSIDRQTLSLDFSITNPDPAADYFRFLSAEIPNRGLAPIGFGFYDPASTAEIAYNWIPDADYHALAAKTDMLTSALTSSRFSFALQYAEDISEWAGGISLDDADFLPYFDYASTSYDYNNGLLTWDMESAPAADIDAFVVIIDPWRYVYNYYSDLFFVVLPGTARSYQVPDVIGYSPSEWDTAIVIALDLPFDFEEGFDPNQIFAYDFNAASLWVYPSISDTIAEITNFYL